MIDVAYVICTTPRTGSNLLSGYLQTCGAGTPDEWLDMRFLHERFVRCGVASHDSTTSSPHTSDPIGYLHGIVRQTGETGFLGLKLHWHQFAGMSQTGMSEVFDLLNKVSHNVVTLRLRRLDLVRQAVSAYIADSTGQYSQPVVPTTRGGCRNLWLGAGHLQSTQEGPIPDFDYERIHGLVKRFAADEQAWDVFFRSTAMPDHTLVYEDLARDPSVVVPFLTQMGLGMVANIPPGFVVQATSVNDDYVSRYHMKAARRDR